jgi:hypothetical protein
MDGAWASYPGYGSLWVSAYPWGWMPYMYGSWVFVPGAGWMWSPGGWSNWNGSPRVLGTPPQRFKAPVAPTTPGSTVVVGGGGPVLKENPRLRGTTVIASGSAGLNVPRGSLGNLAHLNREVTKTGSFALVSAPHAYSAVARPSGFEHPTPASPGGMHSGSAPASHSGSGGRPH